MSGSFFVLNEKYNLLKGQIAAITNGGTPVNLAKNLADGSGSQIPYQTATNTTSFIPNGTSGQYLKSNGTGAPSWATIPSATTPTLAQVLTAGNKASTTLDMSGNDITNATNITATTFIGDLSGNVSITNDNTSSTFYPVFVSNNTGNLPLKVDKTTSPLSYVPSTGTLTTQVFAGALSGGINASAVNPTTSTPTYPCIFTATTGGFPLTGNGLTYIPSTNALTATTFVGDLSGTATNAQHLSATLTTTSGTYYPAFVNSNNVNGNYPNLFGSMTYNPSTNTLTANTFNGVASRANNISGGLGGYIPYQSAVNTTALLANGTAGQVLTSQGGALAPTWTTISSGSNATTINITDTDTAGTYYPTFVSGSGSTQTLRVDASNNPLSYNPSTGRLTTENMYIGTGADPAVISSSQIQKVPSNPANSTSYTIFAQNTGGSGFAGTAYTEIRSGNGSVKPRIEQLAYKNGDFTQRSYSSVEYDNFDIATIAVDDPLEIRAGVRGFKDASLNSGFPVSMLSYFETNNAPPPSTYNQHTGVRVYPNTIEMFVGTTQTATANIASFLVNSITLRQPLTLTQNSNSVANFTDVGITFNQNLVFQSNKGMRLNSFNQGNGTGTTNLSRTTDQFRTAINTPTTTGRIFVLPVPVSPDDEGIWYGICNKSTLHTIAVHYPAGTLIATIPVSPNATHGGSFARFAVGNGSINYYRCG